MAEKLGDFERELIRRKILEPIKDLRGTLSALEHADNQMIADLEITLEEIEEIRKTYKELRRFHFRFLSL